MRKSNIFLTILLAISTYKSDGNICCAPDQFEAFLFYDNGNAFIDVETAYSYMNGSVRAAYDYTNQRSYLSVSGVSLTPLVPQAEPSSFTVINDFIHGIQYSFRGDTCEKTQISNMTKQCIPGSAVHVSSGTFGDSQTRVETFTYRTANSPYLFTTSVDTKVCMAVAMTYVAGSSEPDSGTLNSVLVGDVTTGIKDVSIFTPPKSCLGSNKTKFSDKAFHEKAKALSLSFPFFI